MRLVPICPLALCCAAAAYSQAPPANAPLTLDLREALARARGFSQQFLAASTAASLAHEDRVQAKAALLPTLSDFTQYIYTQGNGTPSGVFVANDGVHVYNQQAAVHGDIYSAQKLADYRRTQAAEIAAQARRDIAVRGLAVVVAQSYYGAVSAQRHLENARRGVQEAQRFLDITQRQERGGEAAHADVIRAQLQLQQRQRDQVDAEAAVDRAKLTLAVLIFTDIGQPFNVLDDLKPDLEVLSDDQLSNRAVTGNPELRAAEAGVEQANFGLKSARGAYLPALTFDYFWGIDANVFGIHGPDDRSNLGSVVQGTMTVPVWNWGATRSRVRQAELVRQQAQTELTLARRQVDADVRGFTLEARTARAQLGSLRDSLDLAAESLRLTLLRYEAGESTALEVVDAQSTLNTSRNAYDDGLARYRLAVANIEVLTGTL